jgi:hypothetical protein
MHNGGVILFNRQSKQVFARHSLKYITYIEVTSLSYALHFTDSLNNDDLLANLDKPINLRIYQSNIQRLKFLSNIHTSLSIRHLMTQLQSCWYRSTFLF